MDGSAEDGIPYATYVTGSSKAEVSTLSEVRQRLGLDDESSEEDTSEDNSEDTSEDNTSQENDVIPILLIHILPLHRYRQITQIRSLQTIRMITQILQILVLMKPRILSDSHLAA